MPEFHLPERRATLVFEDGDLKGLELEVRLSLPFDALFKMQTMLGEASDSTGLQPLMDLLHYFAEECLIGWNLSNGAGPVELTPDALTAHLDAANAGTLLRRYLTEVGKVPTPLARRQGAGRTSASASGKSRRRS